MAIILIELENLWKNLGKRIVQMIGHILSHEELLRDAHLRVPRENGRAILRLD